MREPVVGLVLVRPEVHRAHEGGAHGARSKKRVDLLHQAERIELAASPYIIYDFGPYMSVTRTDTWTNYQSSPQPIGQPFGVSWIQLQLIEPGAKASTSYAGTPWVIAFMVGTTALVGTVGYVRRRREERQPFELPDPGAHGSAGQVKPVLKKIAVALGTLRLRPRLQLLPVPHRRRSEERPDPRQPAAERGRPRAADPPARARPGLPDAVSDLRRRHPARRLRHELPDQPARLDDDVGGAAEHADPGRHLDAPRHVHRLVARHLRRREPRLTRRHRRGADVALLLCDARLLGGHGR